MFRPLPSMKFKGESQRARSSYFTLPNNNIHVLSHSQIYHVYLDLWSSATLQKAIDQEGADLADLVSLGFLANVR